MRMIPPPLVLRSRSFGRRLEGLRAISTTFWTVALALLLATSAARATEQAERLYSLGLVEFHAARYAPALDLFKQAVAADPADPYALYYRGVTYGRLEDYPAALADLRTVLEKKPDLEQGALELGIVLVKSGTFAEAVPWLERAQRLPSAYPEASLFLGIAQLRLGQPEPALINFERAGHDSALRVPARYYQGVANYHLRRWQEAEEHFTAVVTETPDTPVGREAAEFLARLRSPDRERPSSLLYADVGFQYDTNVALAPSDNDVQDAVGVSDKGDGRAVITVGGAYIPLRTQRVQLLIGYELYQSLHFDLTEFNLQDHRPSAEVVVKTDLARLGFGARYDYYLLDTGSFLQSVHATPWVAIPEGGLGRTELFYRLRWRDFYKAPFETLRDAYNHSPGMRQFFYLGAPERYVALGYRFDREDPLHEEGNVYAYDGHEVSAGIGWSWPIDLSGELTYAFRNEDYAVPRTDNEHRIEFAVEKGIIDHVSVVAAYFGVFNNSTDERFDYNRQIGSLLLRVRF